MKLTSIKMKTLLIIMPMLLLVMIALSGISYYYSRQLIEKELAQRIEMQMQATLAGFHTKLVNHKTIPETLARVVEKGGDSISKEQYASFLKNVLSAKNELTLGAGIWFAPGAYKPEIRYFGPYAYKDKGQIAYTEDYEKAEYDYPNQDWYKMAANTGETVVFSAPYYDELTKITMLTASAPFYDANKKLRGMITADMDITSLQQSVVNIKVGEKGWAFLLGKDGTYIADRNPEKVMKAKISEDANPSLAEAGKLLLQGKAVKTSFNENKESYLLYSAPLGETGWILALAMPESEIYGPLNKLLSRQVIIALLAIVLVTFGIVFYARFITNNINEVKRLSNLMAEGDLRQKVEINSADEFGQMGENFNRMLQNLQRLLHKIMDNSQQVAASSEQLTANAQQTAKATEHIAQSIQDIAGSIEAQAASTSATTNSVNVISSEISHISTNMKNVTEMTAQTADRAVEGNKVVNQAIGQMTLINDSVGSAAGVVNILGDKSREIDQISSLITNIAGQTNLLALNAAIEAARAGEQGRGFAVVADEVRKLAEQSETAAKQISSIINEIQQETGRAVQIMGESTASVQTGISMVNQAEGAFREIQTAIQRVACEASDIAQAIGSIASGADNIAASVRHISESTNQTSASIETVAASTEEQNASMEEIQAASVMLAELAGELDEAMQHFKL